MSEDLVWHKTHCARMDQGGCSLLIGVRQGRVVRVKGDPDGYLNQGYICAKARSLPERLYHPQRILYPYRRVGPRGAGRWERITWEQALEAIVSNLETSRAKYGAQGVAFGSGMPKGLDHFALLRLANCFGSPNVVGVQDVCHMPRELAGRLTCGFYPVPDYRQSSELVMLWGSNPLNTNEEGAICKSVMQSIRRAGRLIVVDPKKTPLAEQADIFLQPMPGTDAHLALGMLHAVLQEGLFDWEFARDWLQGLQELREHCADYDPRSVQEVTRVPQELIRQAARLYAASNPAVLGWGNALEQTPASFDSARSLVCLMALCGNLDRAGGNIWALDPEVASLRDFVRLYLLPNKSKTMLHAGRTLPGLATVPANFFRSAVLENEPYPVRAAYLQGTNPLLSWAESPWTFRALHNLDFLAVAEIYPTATTALADIVLPAAVNPEFEDIGHYGLGHGYILARPQVVSAPGQCWPDLSIINELGHRLTDSKHWYSESRGLLEEVLEPAGLDYEQFCAQGVLKGREQREKYLEQGFPTPSSKIELRLSKAQKLGVSALPAARERKTDPAYPLLLTTAKNSYYLHSAFRWVSSLRSRCPEPVAEIHPETAREFGVQDQDLVSIQTARASIVQRIRFAERILPGVVLADSGWWFPEKGGQDFYLWQKSNYNMLTCREPAGKELGTPELRGLHCTIKTVQG